MLLDFILLLYLCVNVRASICEDTYLKYNAMHVHLSQHFSYYRQKIITYWTL